MNITIIDGQGGQLGVNKRRAEWLATPLFFMRYEISYGNNGKQAQYHKSNACRCGKRKLFPLLLDMINPKTVYALFICVLSV
ncbi:MAG: hypothetical protein IJN61_05060 [Clostridia bacterium]|nr:hypothetical protein [Clostridia bacterium]